VPYVRKGKTVYKRTNGLKKKGSSKSVGMAKRYMRALYHAEGGRKFTKRKNNPHRKKKRGYKLVKDTFSTSVLGA